MVSPIVNTLDVYLILIDSDIEGFDHVAICCVSALQTVESRFIVPNLGFHVIDPGLSRFKPANKRSDLLLVLFSFGSKRCESDPERRNPVSVLQTAIEGLLNGSCVSWDCVIDE